MSDPMKHQSGLLLTTKLNPPLIRSDILGRPHLIAKLEDMRHPLTVITAPAGYGKSTLATQWLEGSSLPGVWVSLDKEDNDIRVFLSYFIAAVRRHEPTACRRIYGLLDAPALPPSDVLEKLLVNDLEKITKPFLLMLDDYHLITDPEIHNLLDHVLKYPLRSLHLVIMTRRDPSFSLISMKAHGQVVEIRESDLRFDSTETRSLLKRLGNISLDEKDLTRVMDNFEGWVAGLCLYCLATDNTGKHDAFISGRSGDTYSVQDYLAEQVLLTQSPQMQEYLLKTSILDRFCASLCEAVCGDSVGENEQSEVMSGHGFMQSIVAANLFGIQLEGSGDWIRYHHIFQELLCNQLQRKSGPQEVAELHRRAAQWFGDQGLIEEGLKHAQASGDSELAADIIEGNRPEMMKKDKWQRLGKCLDLLPSAVEKTRPHLLMCRAYVLMYSGRFAEIPAMMDEVVMLAGESPSEPMLAGELHFFLGMAAFFMGDLESCKRHFDAVQATATSLECQAESEMHGCVSMHLAGKRELAVNKLRTAIQRNEPVSLFYQTRLMFGLSFVHSLAGRWPASSQAAEYLEILSRKNDLAWATAWAANMRGNATLQMLDLEQAERSFSRVFDWRYVLNPRAVIDALVGLALSRQLQGREAEADQCLQEASDFAQWTGTIANLDVTESGRARIDLLRGNQDAATRWLAAFHGEPEVTVKVYFREYPEITACRVLVAWGTPESLDKAASQLEHLEEEFRRFHLDCHLVPILVMKSLLACKQDRLSDALRILHEAVDLSWPGRWMLPFIEGGNMMAELLRQLPLSPEWGDFVGRTLARYDQGPGGGSMRTPQAEPEETLIIDLTNREADVLELLCERLYDKEIAARLFISPATVKTHLSHIYGKLEVTNRREAVKKAKRLGLV